MFGEDSQLPSEATKTEESSFLSEGGTPEMHAKEQVDAVKTYGEYIVEPGDSEVGEYQPRSVVIEKLNVQIDREKKLYAEALSNGDLSPDRKRQAEQYIEMAEQHLRELQRQELLNKISAAEPVESMTREESTANERGGKPLPTISDPKKVLTERTAESLNTQLRESRATLEQIREETKLAIEQFSSALGISRDEAVSLSAKYPDVWRQLVLHATPEQLQATMEARGITQESLAQKLLTSLKTENKEAVITAAKQIDIYRFLFHTIADLEKRIPLTEAKEAAAKSEYEDKWAKLGAPSQPHA
jgi:DNA-binding transcriptional regulator YiaG